MYNRIVGKLKLKTFLINIFILGIIFFQGVYFADSQITVQENEINYEMIPVNPEPYEEVTIRLYSYATDIDKAFITWQSSNGMTQSGIGKKNITFNAPGPDLSVSFDITINPAEQSGAIKKKIVISPSDIDLLWESLDGYTPPFYKGKSLPSRGGIIKVVALPNSNTITSGIGKIDYTWKNSDKTQEESSGYNMNSYYFKNSAFETINSIEVVASSVSGNYNAIKKVGIPLYNPSLVFYKKSPTDGILYNKGITTDFSLDEDQVTFVASPYNLATGNNDNLFDYTWYVNGEMVSTPKKNEISIRPTSRDGYVEIGLRIENLQELFQKVTNVFNVNL